MAFIKTVLILMVCTVVVFTAILWVPLLILILIGSIIYRVLKEEEEERKRER